MTTVCLSLPAARARLRDLDVEVLEWDGLGDPPDGLARVQFLVPRYMDASPDAEVLAAMPRLRVVQLLSSGYEQWRPIVPAGVVLCNGRGLHGASTAELAIGGLIALMRDLPKLIDQQRQKQWLGEHRDGLDGRRVLVLGAGDIGSRVATVVTALGASATVVGRTARDGVYALEQVPALLPDHDVVVIALPYSDQTHHLVDSAFLAAMPDGARLVNVARGAIVDTAALLAELTARRLWAYLDVTDPEPLPADHRLWSAPNLLITPHVGGGTTGWEGRALTLIHDQLARLLANEPLVNVI